MSTMRNWILVGAVSIVAGCSGGAAPAGEASAEGAVATKEAFLRECTATRVLDPTVFEESLSIEEYPEVSIERKAPSGDLDVYIGASAYSSTDKDVKALRIRKQTASDLDVEIELASAPVVYALHIAGEQGEITVTEAGKSSRVAEIKCAAGPTPPAPKSLTLREEADGKAFTLTRGQRLVVKLASNATTGFDWYVKDPDESLGFSRKVYTPPASGGPVGSGGTTTTWWATEESKPGRHHVLLEYRRDFTPEAIKTFSFDVTVE